MGPKNGGGATDTLDTGDVLAAVTAGRLVLATFLDTLDDGDWAQRSLCPAWTVREVVAHLALSTRSSSAKVIVRTLLAGGDIDRVERDLAVAHAAAFTPDRLVAQLRETAASTRHLLGSTPWDRLLDVLVHGQDIARPLGRTLPLPPALLVPALDALWGRSFYKCRKRFAGLRFVATDGSWSAGDAALEVRGPLDDLLLVSAGRRIDPGRLAGPGVSELADRLPA